MAIIHLSDWLKITLIGWVVISVLAAPLIGRFLAGALHERTDEPQRSAAPRIRAWAPSEPRTAVRSWRLRPGHSSFILTPVAARLRAAVPKPGISVFRPEG